MSQESFSEIIRVVVWLAIHGAAALTLAYALFCVVWGPFARASNTTRTCLLAMFALGVLPALDFGRCLAPASASETGGLLAQTLFLAAGMLLARFVLSWNERPLSMPSHQTRFRFAACLLAAGLPPLFWSSHRLRETPAGGEELAKAQLAVPTAESLTEVVEFELQTDRGARVPIYRFANPEQLSENRLVSQLRERTPTYSQTAIQLAPAGIQANCHGWVFAEGEYIIRGEAVERILQDNDYLVVSEPQPGDLIVYRDADNNVLHTGVVKATGTGGFSLIESKWGLHGRYLHEPEQQSYSDNFAYFRSTRRGHRLNEARNSTEQGARRAELKASESHDGLIVTR